AKSLLREIESKKVQASSQLSLLDQLHQDVPVYHEVPVAPALDPEMQRQTEKMKALMEELAKFPLMQVSPLEVMNQVAKWKDAVASSTEMPAGT
ncbi:MAG: hypothetical protein ACKOX6_03815, partial [Bdellovibrio sp.]